MTEILSLNIGSSSTKFALYRIIEDTSRSQTRLSVGKADALISGVLQGIGGSSATLRLFESGEKDSVESGFATANHTTACGLIIAALRKRGHKLELAAVGHRLVHGGAKYTAPRGVTSELIAELKALIPLAPQHLPHEIEAIETMEQLFPGVKQIVCFDTAFHHELPTVAKTYALPKHLGIVRYGFHGLSCEYIYEELARTGQAKRRTIIAHLGNGASMTAVLDGKSIDTTMGFTPAGGLVMSTRSGDLDPGILTYVNREKKVTAQEMDDLFNRHSGLLAVSGTTSEMRELVSCYATDPRARAAVELFCYSARKAVGALAAVLGGVDALVFTAGIGEHGVLVRSRICAGLDFLGIRLAEDRNSRHAEIISESNSAVSVHVIGTDEELMVARHTRRLLLEATELESHCA